MGVEGFPGNTQDASTVPPKIAQIQNDYGVKEILFVGDRGMITQANAEKVRGIEGLNTISALTHRQIVDLLKRKVITPELFDEKRILEVIDPEDPCRRYELCRNPWTAQRETTTRQNLLEVTRQALDSHSIRHLAETVVGHDLQVGSLHPHRSFEQSRTMVRAVYSVFSNPFPFSA